MTFKKKDIILQIIEKGDKAFDCFNTLKPDAYSMPSKFYATTVFYAATENETQTFLTTIDAVAYFKKDKIGEIFKTDEFDTRRAALKWINDMYSEFLKILEQ